MCVWGEVVVPFILMSKDRGWGISLPGCQGRSKLSSQAGILEELAGEVVLLLLQALARYFLSLGNQLNQRRLKCEYRALCPYVTALSPSFRISLALSCRPGDSEGPRDR